MRKVLLAVVLPVLSCAGPLPFEETEALPPVEEPRVHAEGAPIVIAELAIGKEIEVAYHSQGCFHNNRARLTLVRLAEGVRVTVRYKPWEGEYSTPVTRMLTSAEVAALDEELGAVRGADPQGMCTTTTEYLITTDGAEMERLFDGTCALWVRTLDEGSAAPVPAITFGRLVWEVAEPILTKRAEAMKGG